MASLLVSSRRDGAKPSLVDRVDPSSPRLNIPGPTAATALAGASDTFSAAVVDYFVGAADLLGVPKSLAIIYGICFASAEPLSVAEIKARTALSAGSLSQGLRFLTNLGALQAVALPGQRLTRYAPDIELRKLLLHYFEHRVEAQLRAGKTRLKEIQALESSRGAGAKVLRGRLKALSGWQTRSQALLPLVKGALRLA